MGIHIDHISLLVKDLDQAVSDWREILAVLSPGHLEHVTTGEGADEVDGTPMKWVTFQSPEPTGLSIQMWSPSESGHWPDKVLEKKGDYVHHIAFLSDDFDGMIERVKEAKLPLVMEEASGPNTAPWLRWNFIPPTKGHGPLVELATRYLAVGDQWLPHPANTENTALKDELTERFVNDLPADG